MEKSTHKITKHKNIIVLGVIFGLMLFSGTGNATTFKLVQTNTGSVISDTPQVVHSGWFFLANANNRTVITFNAECSVAGPAGNNTNWLNVDILIGGVALTPTNSDNALCTANGTAGTDGWVSAVSMGTRVLPAGWHFLQIRVNDQIAGQNYRVDDRTVIVESQLP